jgi:hypothetical protein
MRRALLPVLVLLAGCTRPSHDSSGLESRVKILEDQVADLRTQNAELRDQNEALENRITELESRIAALPAASPPPPPRPVTARCAGTSPNFRLTRADVDEVLGDLADLSMEVRLVPYIQGGSQPVGFKMYSIRPDSFVASCGFKNGDVLKTFNGLPLNSPDKALEAYAQLRKAERVDVALDRAGQPMTVTFTVK